MPVPAPSHASALPTQATFGELPAFVTLASLLLQYALGMAAVARGFSRYLARLCNLDPTIFVKEIDDSHFFDFMASRWGGVGAAAGRGERVASCSAKQSRGERPLYPIPTCPSHRPGVPPQAAGVVMLMSVLLSMGVRESAWFISSERPLSRGCGGQRAAQRGVAPALALCPLPALPRLRPPASLTPRHALQPSPSSSWSCCFSSP